MSSNLSASVGRWERRARNRPADVEVVQRLLETAAHVLQAPQLDHQSRQIKEKIGWDSVYASNDLIDPTSRLTQWQVRFPKA